MRLLVSAIASVLLAGLVCTTMAAGQIRYIPDAPGKWKPWSFTAYPDTRRQAAAQPADIRAVESQLLALNTIIKSTPGLAAPVGFSVETAGSLDLESWRPGQPDVKTLPLPVMLNFGAYAVYEFDRGGKTVREDGGETTQLLFFVNQLALRRLFKDPVPDFQEMETDVALQPASQGELFGMTRYGDSLVLKKTAAPVWTTVLFGEALDLAGRAIALRLKMRQEVAARLQNAYDNWKDPAKRDQRIAQYKTSAALAKDPGLVDKMMKFEQRNEADLAAMVGPTSDIGKEVIAIEGELATAKAAAAAIPAADRAAPGCYAERERTLLARFKRAPSAGCVGIVRPNWKLFNPALPRSAPQVLVIGHFEGCLFPQPSPNAGGCTANMKLLEAIDKQAILAWLQ